MRVSSLRGDPGYPAYVDLVERGRAITILLDGKPLAKSMAITADERQSYVDVVRRNADGNAYPDPLNPGSLATERLNGVVRVRTRRARPLVNWCPMRWAGRHDGDRYWGPFTYSVAGPKSTPNICLALWSCGGDDDGDGSDRASLHLGLGRRRLILALPGWVCPPWRRRVFPRDWSPEVIKQLGRDWYWDVKRRRFGVQVTAGGDMGYDYLTVDYGVQTWDSSTDRTCGWFLPWAQMNHVRTSHYDAYGRLHYTEPNPLPRYDTLEYRAVRAYVDAVPTRRFAFLDFDGERLTATTRIEEREWHRGTGWFKWLRWFCDPMVVRRLSIQFSGETGERKGSWKGGTLATNGPIIDDLTTPWSAFGLYCAEHRMTLVGELFGDETYGAEPIAKD